MYGYRPLRGSRRFVGLCVRTGRDILGEVLGFADISSANALMRGFLVGGSDRESSAGVGVVVPSMSVLVMSA